MKIKLNYIALIPNNDNSHLYLEEYEYYQYLEKKYAQLKTFNTIDEFIESMTLNLPLIKNNPYFIFGCNKDLIITNKISEILSIIKPLYKSFKDLDSDNNFYLQVYDNIEEANEVAASILETYGIYHTPNLN